MNIPSSIVLILAKLELIIEKGKDKEKNIGLINRPRCWKDTTLNNPDIAQENWPSNKISQNKQPE